jgi:hypothetical protein
VTTASTNFIIGSGLVASIYQAVDIAVIRPPRTVEPSP